MFQLTTLTLPYKLYDLIKLQLYIKSQNSRLNEIIDSCTYNDIVENNFTIISNETFTEEDLTLINQCIENYTNPLPIELKIKNLNISKQEISSLNFKTIFSYYYQHKPNLILKEFILNITSNTTQNTSIRVVNISTNEIIGYNDINENTGDISINVNTGDVNININQIYVLEIQIKSIFISINSVVAVYQYNL